MRRLAPTLVRVAASACLLGLGGCANAIIFGSGYLAGIQIDPVENGQQSVKVGLEKAEGVVMPACYNTATAGPFDDCEVRGQAYSVLSMAKFQTGTLLLGGLTDTSIRQVFATGAASRTTTGETLVQDAFLVLAGREILPDAALKDAARLNSAIDAATEEEWGRLLPVLNGALVPASARDRASAKLLVVDTAEDPAAEARLTAALAQAGPIVAGIEARRPAAALAPAATEEVP